MHAHGSFCWSELSTTDAPAAKKFYTSLFDWTTEESECGVGTYCKFLKDGKHIGGMMQHQKEQIDMKLPSYWLIYVNVDDVDKATETAKSLGGHVVKEPFDVCSYGRMAIFKDPKGALFALWKSTGCHGYDEKCGAGRIGWHELATTDPAPAEHFYTKLFGWGVKTAPEYKYWTHHDANIGGLEVHPQSYCSHPHWRMYVEVADCEAALKKAVSLGASVKTPVTVIEKVGSYCVLADPTGGIFCLIKWSHA